MQVDRVNYTATEIEKKSHLRVAAINSDENAPFFLYVGKNETSIKYLMSNAISGVIAENFENAKKIIQSENFNAQSVDVIILDVAYNANELNRFQTFLKNAAKGCHAIPILYNEACLSNHSALECAELVDDVIDLNNFTFNLAGKISFLKKARTYTCTGADQDLTYTPAKNLYKRAFDIIASSILILLALPFLVLIAIAIKLESKGPIFYNAKRAGRGFKIFKFYKFRTMVVNADKKIEMLAHLNQYSNASNGAQFFKIANDPRITKVGRFLRNTSLDELPQLFNVLKGDMSLVGNRPLPLYEAATLTTNDFAERFMAPAGITGLWQIKKRGQAEMSIDERISLDIAYARKSTLLYDFWIMASTPKALLQKSNV